MTKRKGSLAPIKIVVSPIPASSRRVTGNVILPCPSKEVLKAEEFTRKWSQSVLGMPT